MIDFRPTFDVTISVGVPIKRVSCSAELNAEFLASRPSDIWCGFLFFLIFSRVSSVCFLPSLGCRWSAQYRCIFWLLVLILAPAFFLFEHQRQRGWSSMSRSLPSRGERHSVHLHATTLNLLGLNHRGSYPNFDSVALTSTEGFRVRGSLSSWYFHQHSC